MSTLKLENIKHENSVTNNMVMDSDGSVSVTNKLGVDNSNPFSTLHVHTGRSGPSPSGNMSSGGATFSNSNGGRAIQIGVDSSDSFNYIQSSYVNNANVATDLKIYTGANARLIVDGNGYVTMPYQPSFKVYDNTGTEYTNTTLLPNVVVHDTGSNFNTSNGRFTCPVDGVYLFRCDWRQTGAGAGYFDIRASDGQLIRHEEPNATVGNWFHQSMTAIFKLSANDYVWLQSGGSKGIRWDTNPVNHFAGVLIG